MKKTQPTTPPLNPNQRAEPTVNPAANKKVPVVAAASEKNKTKKQVLCLTSA